MKILTILSSVFLLETLSHHIIFENIGQLASAVTYIHAKVAINFSAIEDQHLVYTGMLHAMTARLHQLPSDYYNYSVSDAKLGPVSNIYRENLKHCQQILLSHIIRSDWVTKDLIALRATMPHPKPKDDFMVQDEGSNTTDGNFHPKQCQQTWEDC